jgi:hypothetical protein
MCCHAQPKRALYNKLKIKILKAKQILCHRLKAGFFFYSYVHTMFGSLLPSPPTLSLTTHLVPSLSPQPPPPGRNYFTLISNFVEERV